MLTDEMIYTAPADGRWLTDGKGLRLRCAPRGKVWHLKSATGSKVLGAWPAMSINEARFIAEKRRDAPEPASAPAPPKQTALTFAQAANKYIVNGRGRDGAAPARKTVDKRRWAFEQLGKLHSRPLADITAQEVANILQAIQAEPTKSRRPKLSTVAYVGTFASSVFKSASLALNGYNPCASRTGWDLIAYRAEHHPAVTDPKGFGQLAGLVDGFSDGTVAHATQMLMRVVVRPGELRGAQWQEFHDMDKPELARWEIPGSRMKMGLPHVVPLSRGALAVLRWQATISPIENGAYVFPNARVPGECMSTDSMSSYLERFGYGPSVHTGHSFRRSFGTLARRGRQPDAIVELCLAHADRNAVRAAYNEWQAIDERRELMTWWDSHIEELKDKAG